MYAPPRARPRPRTNPRIAATAVSGAVLALAIVALNIAFESHYVARLKIRNATPYDIDVQVSGNGRTWMPLAVAEDGATTVIEEVADQGGTWHFRLRAQGIAAGDVTVTRGQLAADRWTFDVAAGVGDRLRANGAPLPP